MIQNTTQANQPAQVNPLLRRNQADDFIRLQDLFYLCLAKWRWFILSLAVTIGIATYYILTTPNVYQRTASLMIKDDSKSQGISSDVSSMFADMGLGNAKSNVNNELIAIQSPAVLLETGKRLKLDVDYAIDGASSASPMSRTAASSSSSRAMAPTSSAGSRVLPVITFR